MNKEVIAVDQDSLGRQGHRVIQTGLSEVWIKKMADGAAAIAMFNRGDKENNIAVRWTDLGLVGNQQVRDLWRHTDVKDEANNYRALVPAHGSVLLMVRQIKDGA